MPTYLSIPSHRLRRILQAICVTLSLLCLSLPGQNAHAQQDPAKAAAIQLLDEAGVAYNGGQLARALDYFQRALTEFQRIGDKGGVAVSLSNIGLMYKQMGQYQKSLEHYARALAVMDENTLAYVNLIINIGEVTLAVGQPAVAIKHFTRAAELYEARSDRRGYAAATDGMAMCCTRMRQFDKALEYQYRALDVIKPTGNLRDIARVLGNIGATGKAKGDYTLATRYITESLELKRKFARKDELAGSLTNLGLIYFDTGRNAQSVKAFTEAIEYNEAVSREVRDASKVGDYQDWFRSSLYRRCAHALINLKKPDEALAVLERGRGQGLARQAAQNRADYSSVLSAAEAEKLRSAQNTFNAASEHLKKTDGLEFLADEAGESPGTRSIREARSRYESAERLLSAVRTELSAHNPNYKRLNGTAPPTAVEMKELAAKNPDTLYLQWAVGAEATSLLFTLSAKEGIQSFVLNGGEGVLHKQVRAWREAITSRENKQESKPEQSAAQALYTALFEPLEKAGLLEAGRYKRLVLVGDGPLLEVPFGALLDASGKRLIERFPLAIAGSFGVLTWAETRSKPSESLLVVADPLAPGVPPLPAARVEGTEVASLFSGSRLLAGSAAVKAQVMSDLGKFRILHFATHGLLDPKDGLSCGLLLASKPGSDDDLQLLEARDLIAMRLTAQLAVLSACETGQGQESGGEGVLGLTWAFRAAGCPSVVASLWSVEDTATKELMRQFYQGLKAGQRKDEALRSAMLAVKKTSPAPLLWAAFQISGETSALPL